MPGSRRTARGRRVIWRKSVHYARCTTAKKIRLHPGPPIAGASSMLAFGFKRLRVNGLTCAEELLLHHTKVWMQQRPLERKSSFPLASLAAPNSCRKVRSLHCANSEDPTYFIRFTVNPYWSGKSKKICYPAVPIFLCHCPQIVLREILKV